jgi:hypothetical protein
MDFETIYNLTGKKPRDKAENGNILGIKSRKRQDRFSFVVRCLESYSNPKGHIASVMFPGIEELNQDQQKAVDVWEDALGIGYNWHIPKKQEVLLKCSCPAFLFYGSEYYASQFGYHIDGQTEDRPPVIRDPEGNRYLCKHLIRVYKYIEKISFERLLKRFKSASMELKMASLDLDIAPAVQDYLTRIKVSEAEVKVVMNSLNMKSLENTLEHYGVIINDSPNKYDPQSKSESPNIFKQEVLK